jgi:hypothetical protein
MTSAARVAANRLNAQRSTGPRTAAGKARSSRNAVKHGLLARQPLLADEDPAEYDELRDRLVEALSPDGAVEEVLVDELLGVLWRLRRLRRVEVALYSIGAPAPVLEALRLAGEADAVVGAAFSSQAHAFSTLSRYEAALVNRLRRTLADLERLRNERDVTSSELVVIAREG